MPMLDFRVETFLAVCRHMNFTKAARELNITQPAVSHHMHYLEQAYGTALFQHNGKRLQLTEAAADFARTVEIGNIGAIKTLLKSGYGVSFLYRAAIRPEEAAGALGVIALSDFELRHDIMFLFPKNSNFRADYTTIFRELRACAEETGSA